MPRLFVSCEHASNAIPAAYRPLFEGQGQLLSQHWAWDPGARELARALARRLDAPLHLGRYSRLLVDLNRSPHNPRRFTRFTRQLDPAQREAISRRYHLPYIEALRAEVERGGDGAVHISVHSFTPVYAGETRNCELGLLYDPARRRERDFARTLRPALGRALPGFRVRCNYPYTGVQDGVIPLLRREYAAARYFGLELELNQALVKEPGEWQAALVECLAQQFEARFAGGL